MSEGTIQIQWLCQIANRKEYMAYQIASLLTAPFKIISYMLEVINLPNLVGAREVYYLSLMMMMNESTLTWRKS